MKLYQTNPNDIIEIVRYLRNKGLIQGKDFDFSYNPGKWDYMGNENLVKKHTTFTFYKDSEKWASWLLLKHGNQQ